MAKNEENLTSFHAKLRRGKSVEDAALEAGIPLEEAHTYLAKTRENVPFDDDSLRLAAAEAMSHGLGKLIEIATAPPRVTKETHFEDGAMIGQAQTESTDLDAAKTLVRFALDARKMIGAKKGAPIDEALKDLFDSNWSLRD